MGTRSPGPESLPGQSCLRRWALPVDKSAVMCSRCSAPALAHEMFRVLHTCDIGGRVESMVAARIVLTAPLGPSSRRRRRMWSHCSAPVMAHELLNTESHQSGCCGLLLAHSNICMMASNERRAHTEVSQRPHSSRGSSRCHQLHINGQDHRAVATEQGLPAPQAVCRH